MLCIYTYVYTKRIRNITFIFLIFLSILIVFVDFPKIIFFKSIENENVKEHFRRTIRDKKKYYV